MTSHRSTRAMVAKKAGSVFCLALFLFLQLVAVAPELHRYLHHDAAQADHQCAVTLLSHGQLDIAVNVTSVVLVSPLVIEIPARIISAPVTADYLLLPGRGPPASILG